MKTVWHVLKQTDDKLPRTLKRPISEETTIHLIGSVTFVDQFILCKIIIFGDNSILRTRSSPVVARLLLAVIYKQDR